MVRWRQYGLLTAALLLFVLAAATPAVAQLNTQHLKGSAGLKAGSQPPPGGYVIAPILFFYTADTIKDRDGNTLPNPGDITLNASLFGAGYSHVTAKKILGGFYGFQVLFPVGANNRIQGTEIDANPGAGITDSVVQPINVGWHFKRADANAGYLIYIPTGRYSDGADNNTGFGMWGQELSFGATAYLTENRQYHAATVASFTFSSKKEDSETKPGAQMNLEGGVGGDFLKGGLTVGMAYYAAFKLSDDDIEGLPGILIRGKNKVFALGPEFTLAIARKGTVYGFVKVNYEWEVYARTTTQGGVWNIAFSWLTKPIKVATQ